VCFLGGADRDADDRRRTKQSPGVVRGEVFFADMPHVRPICLGGQGHVDAVINDERNVRLLTQGEKLARQLQLFKGRGGLGAQLHGSYAAAERCLDHIGQPLGGNQPGVGEQVEPERDLQTFGVPIGHGVADEG